MSEIGLIIVGFVCFAVGLCGVQTHNFLVNVVCGMPMGAYLALVCGWAADGLGWHR